MATALHFTAVRTLHRIVIMNTTQDPATCPPIRPEPAAPTAPKGSDAEVSLGPHIESIAALFGIHPKDVAVAFASVLGGVAGPYAGFVTPVV